MSPSSLLSFLRRASKNHWLLLARLGSVGVVGGALAAGCPDGGECECFPCGSAVTLNVVDADGVAVTDDWTVEASQDGIPVDTTSCTPVARNGLNTCGFGFTTGVYEVVVRTPDQEKQFKARFAERAGQDCCQCVSGEVVPVVLEQP